MGRMVTVDYGENRDGLGAVTHPKLRLWIAYPNEVLTQAQLEVCEALLSKEERERLAAFRFDRHRREFLATRVLLRTALSYERQQSPESWRFNHNAWGKPAVESNCDLRFNVSNCPELVVCLTTEGTEVGIDAEPYTRAETIGGLADEVFSPLEREQIGALGIENGRDRALSLWVLKEAWIKAQGKGMSLPLQEVSFRFDELGDIHLKLAACLTDDGRGPWRYALLDHAGHRIALVAETSAACDLEVREVRPLLTPPRDVALEPPIWHPRELR
jgi:4'-phosphopantetheinyl transferase